MVWIITIVLMSIDICIVFMDPLERQYDLTQVVIAWYLVTLLLDFLFRHNKIYGVIKEHYSHSASLCILFCISLNV